MNIRIAIADDHPMVINGLQTMLSVTSDIQLISSYSNGEELLQGLEGNVPDVLLLDIQLPGKTGEELAPIILKRYPDIKILTLTNFDSALYANSMLRHGVHGYLLKTTSQAILVEAIQKVYNGLQFIEPSIEDKIKKLDIRIQKTASTKSSLTTREKEILQQIVNGYTDPEIAEKLFLSIHTVKNYRLNILVKLDAKNSAALVKKALQLGLAE